MRMIIVGASGMIGSVLFQSAKALTKDLIGTSHSRSQEGLLHYDMCQAKLGPMVGGLGPEDTVYLLSAYTDVSWIRANPDRAAELNVHATKRLIDEIAEADARVVFLSSVEVFDGEEGNYNESSRPNPLSVYGRMKFEIEQYLFKKQCKSCIVRTGWNVGWHVEDRCVIKLTYKTLMAPGAKMARDNIFSIVDIKDTCEGLLKILERPQVTICHLTSAPAVVRSDLAAKIRSISKYKERMSFETVLFADIPYPEKRSRLNQLDNSFAVSSLGMHFSSPENIIRQKVELLDQHFEKIVSERV